MMNVLNIHSLYSLKLHQNTAGHICKSVGWCAVELSYVPERNTFRFVEWRVKKVPEAFSLCKMAYQTLQQEYLQIPVVTRAYTTACVLTTAAVVRDFHMFGVLDLVLSCAALHG